MRFTHLHVHSHYSLLTALPKIEELLAQAKEYGMTSLALTDTSALYGAVEFQSKAKDYGINPIIGAEIFVCKDLRSKNNTAEDRRRSQLVLLVKNELGYKNLMKIISIAQLDGFYYKARADKHLLRQYHEGLIALSGSLSGEIPAEIIYGNYERAKAVALEYQDIFGQGNFYLELGPNVDYENQMIANQGLIQLSRETGIPLVAASDVHYVKREHAEIQDILLCIRDNKKVTDKERFSMMALDLSLRSGEEMAEIFKDVQEAIENTGKIAEACHFKIPMGENHLPEFPLPEGKTSDGYLRELCELGLKKRYGDADITEEYRTRMDYELSVIEKTGFAHYFLIVQDFVNWAKNNGVVVGPGRGSAAGSLVAYLTGITDLDPIKYNLLFERFLNPERISMPDVDMDFADDRRDDVLNYVREKYGNDHVAQIITFGTMAARAAIRDVGRALGFPYDLCDKTSKMIPMFTSITKALEEVPEFKRWYASSPDTQKLIDAAMKVEGLVRHASMHACGVVITKDPVTEYTPLQRVSGSREGVVTQYAASTKSNAVEKIGLLKMDFLGLKNLTIIQNTLRIVRKTKHTEIDIEKIPLDDELTFKLLQEARTTGVFQLESSGMKRYLKQLKPTVFEDIIAMVALYRPGPMEYIPDFISGKHGAKKIKYLHPILEPILQNTYGVAVYQEQLMQIARDLAGFSLGEADVLRKAVGKKIKELVAEQREKFIDGCVKTGVGKNIGEKVFSFIEPFAGYGFNRSHAACYALIGYQTAYLKAHYPAEFMAALLTSDQDNIDRIAIEVREAREMGIEVMPPHINESFGEFAVIIDNGIERIRFGLNAIKNVGHLIAEEIVEERKRGGPYATLEQFIERVTAKDLNKKSLEALIKVGALEGFGDRNQLLESIDDILRHAKNLKSIADTHQNSLFGEMAMPISRIQLTSAAVATQKMTLGWEKELLGLYLSGHPVSDYQEYFNKTTTPISDLEKKPDNTNVRIGGVITNVRKLITKNQHLMYFVGLEDMTGRVELLVFGKTAERTGESWIEDEIVIVDARVSHKDGTFKCVAEALERVSENTLHQFARIEATRAQNDALRTKNAVPETAPQKNMSGRLIITIKNAAPAHIIEQLSHLLKAIPAGERQVAVRIQGATLETTFAIAPTAEHLKQIQNMDGVESVR
ncbi:MAG: DNA polymerase III subunit alpha [Candidatus Moranbacteria bacterium RIFCSPHIGHO2_01_FULL_54_31]|nr:MAG: DNA polymerase III subunit alpha [Candidatus Moranbacteria bacterium RIFCSPHIGHO2_01_FULL_54_31]